MAADDPTNPASYAVGDPISGIIRMDDNVVRVDGIFDSITNGAIVMKIELPAADLVLTPPAIAAAIAAQHAAALTPQID